MKQEIKIFLLEVARLSWLLIKNIILLIVKGIQYIYARRMQIMQHKVTLPALILLSVVWTGFSSFKNADMQKQPFVPAQALTPTEDSIADTGDQAFTKQADDSNTGEPFTNARLIAHIMDWIGTPHQDNRQSKNGTDCSGFVQAVFQEVHGIELSRSSKDMYETDVYKIRKAELQEGDLVFFNTFGRDISHVGIYLKDGKCPYFYLQRRNSEFPARQLLPQKLPGCRKSERDIKLTTGHLSCRLSSPTRQSIPFKRFRETFRKKI
jgi:hypothetical protein